MPRGCAGCSLHPKKERTTLPWNPSPFITAKDPPTKSIRPASRKRTVATSSPSPMAGAAPRSTPGSKPAPPVNYVSAQAIYCSWRQRRPPRATRPARTAHPYQHPGNAKQSTGDPLPAIIRPAPSITGQATKLLGRTRNGSCRRSSTADAFWCARAPKAPKGINRSGLIVSLPAPGHGRRGIPPRFVHPGWRVHRRTVHHLRPPRTQ